jgi:hypothetical protein
MYKLSYYRFGDLKLDYHTPAGFDRTRNAVIGNKDFDLVSTLLYFLYSLLTVEESKLAFIPGKFFFTISSLKVRPGAYP